MTKTSRAASPDQPPALPAPDIVLSGGSSTGKTTLATLLADKGWHPVTARSAILANAGGKELDRSQLQALGAELEAVRPGLWLVESADLVAKPIVLDSARTPSQVAEARQRFIGCLHVHLHTDRSVRRTRFSTRTDLIDEDVSFERLVDSALERQAERLNTMADLVLDTESLKPQVLLARILSRVG